MGVLSLVRRGPTARPDGAAGRSRSGGRGSDDRLVFLAWGAVRGRSVEIARVLGGEAVSLYAPSERRRPHVAWRYLHGALATAWRLRERPDLVIVTSPPIVAGLVAYGCGKLLGFPVALDSHPGAFGAQGDTLSRRLLAFHRYLARRAAFSMVAAEPWAEIVADWGGRPLVVHEAPMFEPLPQPPVADRLRVLYVGRFAGDEPTAAVLDAAAALPGVELLVTGDPDACPASLRAAAPANVRFVGYLDGARYREALGTCHAVLALTTEPGSVMRAAYEAVYVARPLVVSDWPVARETFPCAVHVANDPASIVAGLATVSARYDEFVGVTDRARALQLARWQAQEDRLRQAVAATLARA